MTIPIILIALFFSTPAIAATVDMPVRASIVQCGRMQEMEQACRDNPVCCRFLEPAAGSETDTVPQTTDCEVMVMPDGQEIPACVVNVE